MTEKMKKTKNNHVYIAVGLAFLLLLLPVSVSAFEVNVPTDPIFRYLNEGNKTWTSYTSWHNPGEEKPNGTLSSEYDFAPGQFYIEFLTPGDYYVSWLFCPQKMTGAPCDRPPMFDESQDVSINFDQPAGPYLIGEELIKPESDCCMRNMKFVNAVPTGRSYPSIGDWYVPYNGTRYYAEVTADYASRMYFTMDTSVKPGTYTLHIQQKNFKPDVGGDYGAVNVPITISYGELQLRVKPTTDVYADKTISIEGNNTDSEATYLWIKGQNIAKCGINLSPGESDKPYKALTSSTMQGYWEVFNWDPSLLKIGPGSYEIWASTVDPQEVKCRGCDNLSIKGVCALEDCPTCGINQSASLTLVAPTNNAYVTPDPVERCCCPGEPCGTFGGVESIWLEGKSEGDFANTSENKTLQLWIFGENMVGDNKFIMQTIPMLCDGSYKINLNDIFYNHNTKLCDMDPGTYYILVQNPMYNEEFDVTLSDMVGSSGIESGWVIKSMPVKWSKSFVLDGINEIKGTRAFSALKNEFGQFGIDDTYAETSFVIKDNACAKSVDFVGEPKEGYAPLMVNFKGNATYPVTTWSWDFNNDGVIDSSEQNPSYNFTKPDFYTVKLSVSDGTINRKNVKYSYINVVKPLIANFMYSPLTIASNDTVQFRDLSEGSPNTWNWDFGDGESSAMQSPTHVYKYGGNYTVTLSIGSLLGEGTSKSATIFVSGPDPNKIKADFGANGISLLTVQLQDQSTGYPAANSWLWDFGDGSTSTIQNPVHTFQYDKGTNVSLTVSNGINSDTIIKDVGVIPDFGLEVITTRKVQFKDLSTGYPSPTSWLWDFGDGQTATIQNPIHVYREDGETIVSLTISNGIFSKTLTRVIGVR